jgi:2'-5' RNA ligase
VGAVSETAIVVPVLKAEPATSYVRRQYTRDGAAGMPPHVTLLYPFVDDSLLVGHLAEVESVLEPFRAFDFELRRFDRFDDEPGTLFLAPEPTRSFLDLIAELSAAFPAHPPYGGEHATIVPHLTVAHGNRLLLDSLEAEVQPQLPIRARATEVWLMAETVDGRWEQRFAVALE